MPRGREARRFPPARPPPRSRRAPGRIAHYSLRRLPRPGAPPVAATRLASGSVAGVLARTTSRPSPPASVSAFRFRRAVRGCCLSPFLPALVLHIEDKSPVWAWVRVRSLVLDSVSSPHSRRAYGRALDEFRSWCQESFADGFTRETVQRYRAHLESRALSPSSLNVYLSALRRLAREGAASGLLSQEQAAAVASVPGVRQKGRRLGAWLTLEQAQTLLVAPAGESRKAIRDRALLGLLIGCGLRRDELAHITVEQIQQREGRWVLVDIDGKGRRLRSVPMPGWTKARIDLWTAASGTLSGRLFRAVTQGGEVEGDGITPQAVYLIVRGYAEQLGLSIAPHDLRRTFAQLAHRGRSPLEQIQLSLGHESILTTERYLGVRQSLTDAPCDRLGIELGHSG